MNAEACCKCGKESDYGVHCFHERRLLTLSWCFGCFTGAGRLAYQSGKYLKFVKRKETQDEETQLRLL